MLLRHCCRFWQQCCWFRQQCQTKFRPLDKVETIWTCSICFDFDMPMLLAFSTVPLETSCHKIYCTDLHQFSQDRYIIHMGGHDQSYLFLWSLKGQTFSVTVQISVIASYLLINEVKFSNLLFIIQLSQLYQYTKTFWSFSTLAWVTSENCWMSIVLCVFPAGTPVTGCRHQPRTVADASELSSTCPLVAAAGKKSGKAEQAASGLPALAHHWANRQLSRRHPAEIT